MPDPGSDSILAPIAILRALAVALIAIVVDATISTLLHRHGTPPTHQQIAGFLISTCIIVGFLRPFPILLRNSRLAICITVLFSLLLRQAAVYHLLESTGGPFFLWTVLAAVI